MLTSIIRDSYTISTYIRQKIGFTCNECL